MPDRRRFLHLLGSTALVASCGGGGSDPSGPAAGDASGNGGSGGQGGSDGAGGDPTGTGGDPEGGGGSAGAPAGQIAAGNVADYPTMGLHRVPGTLVLIGRDAGGVYARSSLCTHKKCDMNTSWGSTQGMNGGIYCACHKSSFNELGVPTSGPATAALPALAVSVAKDGTVSVDADTKVDASVRAAIP